MKFPQSFKLSILSLSFAILMSVIWGLWLYSIKIVFVEDMIDTASIFLFLSLVFGWQLF